MKKLVVMVIALGLVFGASAQYKRTGPRNVRPGKTVIVRTYPSISPFYGYGRGYYGYSPLYGYSPFGYGFNNGYMPQNRPTKLDLEVEDIKNEYQDRIKSVRLADDLSRKEKRQKVHELKSMRDRLITETKKNYYKSDSRV
jgi:hypothetical protein